MKKGAAPKQLTSKFFSEMLNIEVNLQKQAFTFHDIDQLIQLYAQAVEYYDSAKDPIKAYFMEKMQILLINKESLRLIIQEQERVKTMPKSGEQKLDESIDNGNKSLEEPDIDQGGRKKQRSQTMNFRDVPIKRINEMNSSEESDSEDEDGDGLNETSKHDHDDEIDAIGASYLNQRRKRYSLTRKRHERSKDFNFMLQVESSKKDQKTEMHRLLFTYEKTALQNEKIVKNNLDSQLKKLRERVIQRKLQNFHAQTMNISKGSLFEHNVDKKWDSFLAELTEEDRDTSKLSAEQIGKDISEIASKQNVETVENLESKNEITGQKDLADTENTNDTENANVMEQPDFIVSPIRKNGGLGMFLSKNNPNYKEKSSKDNSPDTQAEVK